MAFMMPPSEFVPQYDESVLESLGEQVYPIRGYGSCLTLGSAMILASFFEPKPSIVMMPPIQQGSGSPFKFNHFVPWLKFSNGILRNAGALATYWGMPGVPRGKELDYAKWDVETPVEGYDNV
jgi:hypothetical protein